MALVRVLGAGRVEQCSNGGCWAQLSDEGRTGKEEYEKGALVIFARTKVVEYVSSGFPEANEEGKKRSKKTEEEKKMGKKK
jgi:hypothetical protein